MEGEELLLKEAPLSLQTSHTLRELPPSAPARAGRKVVSFCLGRVRLGEVFGWIGRCGAVKSAAIAFVWLEMKILWLSGLKSYGYCGIMEEIQRKRGNGMKQIIRILAVLFAALLAVAVLASCDLMAGPAGPQGEQGEPGKDGKDGEKVIRDEEF